MKGGVRRFGKAERGLLPEGRIAGPMPWVIAIMMFLTVLAAAAGLGLAGAAARLDEQIGSRVTIQIVEANPRLVEWAHAAGMTVVPYTFRSAATGKFASVTDEMRYFLDDLGVDGVFTDNPDRFPR